MSRLLLPWKSGVSTLRRDFALLLRPQHCTPTFVISPARRVGMFTKALRGHPQPKPQQHQQQLKPLFTPSSALNAAASAHNHAAGAKRKFDMTSYARGSALGSLHDAAWVDENDFDDNDMLELAGSSDILDKATMIKTTNSAPTVSETATPEPPPLPEPILGGDGGIPNSSAPLPWSSSPPAHHLPPPQRRTLPWLPQNAVPEFKRYTNTSRTGDVGQNREVKISRVRKPKETTETAKTVKQDKQTEVKEPKPAKMPAPTRTTYPWDTTASAIKAEQKEMRRQQKMRVTTDKKPSDRTIQPEGKLAPIFLSEEQKNVIDVIVRQGKSVFFTGSAGTGKSVLMREVIKRLSEKYRKEPDRVAVTASTGLAACNIEGVTLHSFAGVGLGKEDTASLLKKVCPSVLIEPSLAYNDRSNETKSLAIDGCGQKFSSSMKYPWSTVISLTN